MEVKQINSNTTREWLLYKHYMKRVPTIQKAFGLFDDNELIGVLTYGSPSMNYNDAGNTFGGYKVKTYELNRLVVNEGLEKNTLSWFVSKSFKFFMKPSLIISYADGEFGHHGYIYQALNFLYTGMGGTGNFYVDTKTDIEYHGRSIHSKYGNAKLAMQNNKYLQKIIKPDLKYRYMYIIATKKQKKELIGLFTYECLSYPKGNNKRHDNSYKPKVSKHNYW